jgi:hypothetical protein
MSFRTCRTHSRITADVVGSTCAGETTQAASAASSVVIIGFFCSPITALLQNSLLAVKLNCGANYDHSAT